MSKIHIMSLRHSAFYSPLLLTMAGGYLQQEGLDYLYTPSVPANVIADKLLQGNCHVAQSAVAAGFTGLEQGSTSGIFHFAQINGQDGFFLAGREPDPKFDWDKLRGSTVLVDHLFQPLAMLKFGLAKQRIAFEELNVVDAGDVAQMDMAFRRGQGDYIHQQGPAPQQLEKDGCACVLANVASLVGPVAFSSLCALPSWLSSDMARAFIRAYESACALALSASAREIMELQKAAGFFPDIDAQVLESTIAAYQALGCWSTDIHIPRAAYENLLDVFEFNGLISKRYDYSSLIVDPPIA